MIWQGVGTRLSYLKLGFPRDWWIRWNGQQSLNAWLQKHSGHKESRRKKDANGQWDITALCGRCEVQLGYQCSACLSSVHSRKMVGKVRIQCVKIGPDQLWKMSSSFSRNCAANPTLACTAGTCACRTACGPLLFIPVWIKLLSCQMRLLRMLSLPGASLENPATADRLTIAAAGEA